MSSPGSVTILQLAKAAGVSTATVDRVLNERAGVNPATARRVRDALSSLGGTVSQPGRPKSAPDYRFAYVLPDARTAFFDAVDRVVAQSAGEFRHQHITEVTLRLPSHDPAAFAHELSKLTGFGGIALLAPDSPHVKLAINELVQAGVQVVTLFSDVAGSMRAAFVGADCRAAGRTAGVLLGHAMAGRVAPRTVVFSPPTRFAAEIDRRIGYVQSMEERFGHVEIVRCLEVPHTEEAAYQYALRCLPPAQSANAVASAYSVATGSFGIGKALTERGYAGRAIYAVHDLVEVHRTMLTCGSVDYVLHQEIYPSVSGAARTLRALQDGVRGALSTFRNPRVEIVMQENLA